MGIKGKLARKAAKSTAKHSVRGAASKLKRERMRAGTLLGIGCAVGILVDRLVADRAATHAGSTTPSA